MVDDGTITRALEAAPHIDVPDDFTTRMVARLPMRRHSRVRAFGVALRPSVGRVVARIAIALLFGAILVIARRSQGSQCWLSIQVLIVAELGGLLLWMSYRTAR